MKMGLMLFVGLCVIMALGCIESDNSDSNESGKSVSVGGYNFTADLDDKWVTTQGEPTTYKPKDMEDQYGIPWGANDWTGIANYGAFWYMSGEPIGERTKNGFGEIFVLMPKNEYLEGSDRSKTDILRHAAYMVIDPRNHRNAVLGGDLTEKEIKYNGRDAFLIEVSDELMDGFINHRSLGAIALFLDDDTVALIYFETSNNFGTTAWDAINSITITQ